MHGLRVFFYKIAHNINGDLLFVVIIMVGLQDQSQKQGQKKEGEDQLGHL